MTSDSVPEWRTVQGVLEDYVEPEYYNRLIRPYRFDGKEDLDLLRARLSPDARDVLELGQGTGRVTSALLEMITPRNLDLVDLSGPMLAHVERKLGGTTSPSLRFIQRDSVDYLREYQGPGYDLVYTLWSFSHSVHQHLLLRDDPAVGEAEVIAALENLVQRVLRPGGTFFLIHYDALSDEQRMLMRQWERRYPLLRADRQSPSLNIIQEFLTDLERRGVVDLSMRRLIGEAILYRDLDDALETMMNFHLESLFNGTEAEEVAADLTKSLREQQLPDGRVSVRPGCFEIVVRRLR